MNMFAYLISTFQIYQELRIKNTEWTMKMKLILLAYLHFH